MIISFDLWGTLIRANKNFTDLKFQLVRDHSSWKPDNDVIYSAFSDIKRTCDIAVEATGIQPSEKMTYGLIATKLFIKDVNKFRLDYIDLFLSIGVLPYSTNTATEIKKLSEHNTLKVSSNTVFIPGWALKDCVTRIFGNRFQSFHFSDEVGVSKPDAKMFPIANYHVGDNPATDGMCEKLGINYYQINSNGKHIGDFCSEIVRDKARAV